MTHDQIDAAVAKFREAVAANDERAGIEALVPLVVGTLVDINSIAESLRDLANYQSSAIDALYQIARK